MTKKDKQREEFLKKLAVTIIFISPFGAWKIIEIIAYFLYKFTH